MKLFCPIYIQDSLLLHQLLMVIFIFCILQEPVNMLWYVWSSTTKAPMFHIIINRLYIYLFMLFFHISLFMLFLHIFLLSSLCYLWRDKLLVERRRHFFFWCYDSWNKSRQRDCVRLRLWWEQENLLCINQGQSTWKLMWFQDLQSLLVLW